MTRLSVLDLSPITEGSDATQSFKNSLSLAQHLSLIHISEPTRPY